MRDGARLGGKRRWIISIPLLALSVALTGCQFIGLKREIDKMERFTSFNGEIVRKNPNDNAVVVALFSEKLSLDQLINVKLVDSSAFRFGVPPGKYAIFAFEDTNGDFRYQPEEPAGLQGRTKPILVRADSKRTDVRIEIT